MGLLSQSNSVYQSKMPYPICSSCGSQGRIETCYKKHVIREQGLPLYLASLALVRSNHWFCLFDARIVKTPVGRGCEIDTCSTFSEAPICISNPQYQKHLHISNWDEFVWEARKISGFLSIIIYIPCSDNSICISSINTLFHHSPIVKCQCPRNFD